MNELETQNLNPHDYVIRRSVVSLILKGAFAWILLALMNYGFDWLMSVPQNLSFGTALNTSAVIARLPVFQLVLNVLFGWLMLYIVLDWVFEYFIIKNDTIVLRRGIIFSHEDVYQMEDVKTINVYQGFWGKLFNTGTVSFFDASVRKPEYLSGIDNPNAIAAEIYKIHPGPESIVMLPQENRHHKEEKL
jgi:membrane protein YdbS with pleckstrin-like domain